MKALRQTTKKALILATLILATLTLHPAHAQLAGQLGVLDPTEASGGINPATGEAWAENDQYRLIFLSSTTTTAESGDITTYNDFVQATAAASTAFPELGSASWTMIGSTLTVDAQENTGTDPDFDPGVPIFLTDGVSLFAIDNAELWNTPRRVAPTFTENGVEVENTATRVFTGSYSDGVGVGPGDGTGASDTALGVLDGQGVQTGQPINPTVGRELDFWIRQWKEPATNSLPVYAISEPLSIVTGVAFDLAITHLDYDSENQEVTLTWNSELGKNYVVNYSSDLDDWSKSLHLGLLSGQDLETTMIFSLSGLDVSDTEKLFFQVQEVIAQ